MECPPAVSPLDFMMDLDKFSALSDAFEVFDIDGDGSITVEELGNVMRSLGEDPTDEELATIIRTVDYDQNGSVEFPEFVVLMTRRMQGGLEADEMVRSAARKALEE